MTNAPGQLYILSTRARLRDNSSIEYCEYIISATNKDECRSKLSYFVDLSDYSEFHVRSITRVKPNFHLVTRRLVEPEQYYADKEADKESRKQMQAQNSQSVNRREDTTPTLQPKGRYIFAVGIAGHLIAATQSSALRRLSIWLSRKATGSNEPIPFAGHGHFVVEALGESDSTRVSNLSKNDPLEPATGRRVVSGGAVSPR